MKQKIANYTVVIEKGKRTGSEKFCYTAFVPTLGIAVDADSLEKAKKEIQSLIEFHIDCLTQENREISVESEHPFITRLSAILPTSAQLAY